jgi:hypothetical protein
LFSREVLASAEYGLNNCAARRSQAQIPSGQEFNESLFGAFLFCIGHTTSISGR